MQQQLSVAGPLADFVPPITADDAGLLLYEAIQLFGVLEAAAVEQRREGEPLPRGMFTCGEACRMISAVVGLTLHLFPQLADEGVLETIVRNALTSGTTGAVQ